MPKRFCYAYRYLLPVLGLLIGEISFGQDNKPNTAQQTVSGSLTNTVPIPRASNPWGIQIVTQLIPKYRDTSSAMVTVTAAADKVALKTTAMSGHAGVTYVAERRNNSTLMVQPSDVRYLPDAYSFQAYPSSGYYYELDPIYKSTQYYNSSRYPSEGGAEVSTAGLSASMVRNTSSAAERSSTAYAPGRSRIGQGRGTKTTLIYNDANTGSSLPQANIRIWDAGSNGLPVAAGYYAANALKGNLITTAQGNEKIVLEDREGKPIYEANLIRNNPKTYARTYYVYDEMGRLSYILPPKAVDAIEAASGIVSYSILAELAFVYKYDAKGRQVYQKKAGDLGRTEIAYNKQGQMILRRTTKQQNRDKIEAFFYDRSGRTIATGWFTDDQGMDYWQELADTESNPPANTINYYLWGPGQYTYPPQNIAGTEIKSYNYYDSYEASHPLAGENFSNSLILPFLNNAANAEPYATGGSSYGLLTSSTVKIFKPSAVTTTLQDWTSSKVFYDKECRPIYSVNQNPTGGKDTSAIQYNYLGQVLVSAHGHRYMNNSGAAFREWYRNLYDDQSGVLLSSDHKVNNQEWKIMNTNAYDALGRIASTTYGSNAETQYFNYNIRGELQGINENYALTGNNGGQSMTFGEALRYDYGFDSLRYDGLAAGMIWRGAGGGNVNAHAYGYLYDAAGRMSRGAYMRSNTTPSYTMATGWSNSTHDYSETVSYDQAGNILTLQRRALVAANQMVYSTNVDNLTYTYYPNSNKIQKVVDAVTTNFNRGDFLNGPAQGYTYDYSGNLAADLSKDINGIEYSDLDKPEFIQYAGGVKKIYYIYDAAGNKLEEQVVNSSTNTVKTTYVGTAQYKDGVLQSISTPVGRTDMSKGSPQEQYYIKDHLGNIRSVVVDGSGTGGVSNMAAKTQTYEATYETEHLNQEEQFFDQVAALSEEKPVSTSSGDRKAGMLSTGKTNTSSVGTTLLLKVMAGDKLSLNVENYYESEEETSEKDIDSHSFEQLVNSLAQAAGRLNGTEGIATEWSAQMLNSNNLKQAYEALQQAYSDPSKPKAYLNFLFFDEQMQLMPEYSRIWQSESANNWHRIGTTEEEYMEVPQNGYMVSYISTQSEAPAYFDNYAVTLQPGVLLEEKHYYPYGLPIVGMGSSASNMLPNKKRYQGNEYKDELGLNWMDFHNRQYDPQLGRFLSIDPLADADGQQTLSPYHAMACNPSTIIDPLGLAPQFMMTHLLANQVSPAGLSVEGKFVAFGTSILGSGRSDMMRSLDESMNKSIAESRQREERNTFWNFVLSTLKETDGSITIMSSQGSPNAGAGKIGAFTVHRYESKVFEPGLGGLVIALSYNGNTSGYVGVEWFQTVLTNNPIKGKRGLDIDRATDEESIFIYKKQAYKDRFDISFKELGYEGNIKFGDRPTRFSGKENISWQAELSLIGITQKGEYVRIQTITYGFQFNASTGQYTVSPLTIVETPSFYHQLVLTLPYLFYRNLNQ